MTYFALDYGHNAAPDTGCQDYVSEDKLTKETTLKVAEGLKKAGISYVLVTPSSASTVTNSLNQRTSKANANNVKRYVSIHYNCFNGQAHGTEVLAMSDVGYAFAKRVHDSIVDKCGFTARGTKDGSDLYVIRNTNAPAILIECAFCDHKGDMQKLDTDTMASAIIDALVQEHKLYP